MTVFHTKRYPSDNLAASIDALDMQCVREGDRFNIYSKSGAKVESRDDVSISPDGIRVLTSYEHGRFEIVNLLTGKIVKLARRYRSPTWIDDGTIVAADLLTEKMELARISVVQIDVNGRIKSHRQLGAHSENEGDDFDTLENGVHGFNFPVRAFALGRSSRFLWEFHHSMSDGGYDHEFRINMTFPLYMTEYGTIEAVKSDGRLYVSAEYGWVGGYKRHGAEKLCTLYVRDTKTGKETPIGFRRMDCFGACFVP